VKDQFRHCKPILVVGAASGLLEKAGIPKTLPSGQPDPGLVFGQSPDSGSAAERFIHALAQHRHFARETDPPLV
jgi:catalase